MVFADWIAIAVALGALALGAVFGFGRLLKFFTGGIIGIIISGFVCYCIGGFFLDIPFVQDMLAKFAGLWGTQEGIFFDILRSMHLEIVVYYIVLFLLVQIARVIIVNILKNISEADNVVISVINRVGGALLMAAVVFVVVLLIFQIVHWVGGGTEIDLINSLGGSCFKLDMLYIHNPLGAIVDFVKGMFA